MPLGVRLPEYVATCTSLKSKRPKVFAASARLKKAKLLHAIRPTAPVKKKVRFMTDLLIVGNKIML